MNKENLRTVIFASLKLFGLNIKPFCILNNAYDTLYLPDQNMIIPVDLADDKEPRSPNNPVAQNNTAAKDNLNVFRIRSMECTPIALTSFDYYLEDFEERTVLSLVNYLGAELGVSKQLTTLPEETEAKDLFKRALTDYDDYFKHLCCAYADETGHSALRKKEAFHNERIGVWIDFKGIGFEIKYKGKAIRSRKTSFGPAMDEAHAKGQQKANAKLDEQWIENYNALKKFCAENGGISTVRRNDKLYGPWLTRQRTARRNGKLSPDREQLLDELGVDWEPNNTAEQSWDKKFNMLLEYEKEHGSLDVPQAHCFLGAWVAKQRQLKKKGKLLPERERRLVDIGFVWESPNRMNV